MIEIENIVKSYGSLEVLKGVTMTIDKGEVVSVIGSSGSGKSTLLMCINGLETINSGRILVDGIEVHARTTNINNLRQRIGIVFQQWNAFPHLTVLENVMLAPRKVLGKNRQEAEGGRPDPLGSDGLPPRPGPCGRIVPFLITASLIVLGLMGLLARTPASPLKPCPCETAEKEKRAGSPECEPQ